MILFDSLYIVTQFAARGELCNDVRIEVKYRCERRPTKTRRAVPAHVRIKVKYHHTETTHRKLTL